ncbi:MAG: arsenate reductase (glutaredoxin) [Gammaproteobacteria bacterium]|nr:arsenate reductase (glutaredoxin) [Gammaproteobacteria bacterium]
MSSIYYNPNCSKCRQTKSIFDEKNIDLDIIEYLSNTPTKEELTHITNLGIPSKDLIRTGEDEWSQTGLDIETASDDDLINAIIQYPILLQRPIVIANGKAVIARPPERVLEIL